jgi:hypothetical protein
MKKRIFIIVIMICVKKLFLKRKNKMENKNYVRKFYPEANSYNKNGYWYVQSEYSKGDTLGSGKTIDEAWQMAEEYVKEKFKENVNENKRTII